uniref:CRIB domain-containing protein n=1 Tax=Elaeophora elaphi TaxID=1147741 RepID=A0A0R3RRF6_9BILA
MDKQCIILDVGGRLFKTKVTTLTSIDGSYFQQLFMAKWDQLLDSDGHLFIDRDSDVFPAVLGYLRHGKSYPLPVDDYKLSLIIYEAQFYKLPELIKAAKRIQSYMKRNFIPSKSAISSNPTNMQKLAQTYKNVLLGKEMTPKPVLSIPAVAPPLPQKSTGNDETSMRHFLRKLSKRHNRSKTEIGPPNEFKHIIHVGRADDGHKSVIDHNDNNEKALKAVVQAVHDEISDLPIVYSLVDADENGNHSESVEIFFTGPTIQAYHNDNPLSPRILPTSLRSGFYDNCCYEITRSGKRENFCIKETKNGLIVTDM